MPELLGCHARMPLEGAAEVGGILETQLIGDAGHPGRHVSQLTPGFQHQALLHQVERRFSGEPEAQAVQAAFRDAQPSGNTAHLPLLFVMLFHQPPEPAEQFEILAPAAVCRTVVGMQPHQQQQHAARQPFQHQGMAGARPGRFRHQLFQQGFDALPAVVDRAQGDRQRLHENRRKQGRMHPQLVGKQQVLVDRQDKSLRFPGKIETVHHRRMDGDRHRPFAFPQPGIDLGMHMAAEQKQDLEQAAVGMALDMPVVQPAARFYQLDMDEFGILGRRVFAIQGELRDVSVDGFFDCMPSVHVLLPERGDCQNSTSFFSFHPFFTGACWTRIYS